MQIWKATKLSEEEVQKQREEAGDDGGEGEAFYDKRGIHICDLATGRLRTIREPSADDPAD